MYIYSASECKLPLSLQHENLWPLQMDEILAEVYAQYHGLH